MKKVLIAALMLGGCVSADPDAMFSTVRAHPMGPDQFMITCVDSPRYCAEQAPKSCPSGFDVVSNSSNPADHGRMTMIIKCHQRLTVLFRPAGAAA
jgi:hypothetical protein